MAVQSTAKFNEQMSALSRALNQYEPLWKSNFREIVDQHNTFGFSNADDVSPPAYIVEDADGNVQGFTYTRFDYIEAIAFLVSVERLMTNLAVTTADYQTSLEQVTNI